MTPRRTMLRVTPSAPPTSPSVPAAAAGSGVKKSASERLRLRRAHPRHRGAYLPVVARGLPGSRRGASVRAMGADSRLDDGGLPPAAPPGGKAGQGAPQEVLDR